MVASTSEQPTKSGKRPLVTKLPSRVELHQLFQTADKELRLNQLGRASDKLDKEGNKLVALFQEFSKQFVQHYNSTLLKPLRSGHPNVFNPATGLLHLETGVGLGSHPHLLLAKWGTTEGHVSAGHPVQLGDSESITKRVFSDQGTTKSAGFDLLDFCPAAFPVSFTSKNPAKQFLSAEQHGLMKGFLGQVLEQKVRASRIVVVAGGEARDAVNDAFLTHPGYHLNHQPWCCKPEASLTLSQGVESTKSVPMNAQLIRFLDQPENEGALFVTVAAGCALASFPNSISIKIHDDMSYELVAAAALGFDVHHPRQLDYFSVNFQNINEDGVGGEVRFAKLVNATAVAERVTRDWEMNVQS